MRQTLTGDLSDDGADMRIHNFVSNLTTTVTHALPETRIAYAERFKRILQPLLARAASRPSAPAKALADAYRRLGERLDLEPSLGFCANPACDKSTATDKLSACSRCRTVLVCSKACLKACVVRRRDHADARSIYAEHKPICEFVGNCKDDTLPTCVHENECVDVSLQSR